ncbi:hypothetical protein P3S68_027732 [Capsicum galapagoense]
MDPEKSNYCSYAEKRKAAMQLKRRETYRFRKNSRSHAFLVDPTTAVSERITSASCNSDFPQQTALTIRELPTLPEKASSYQICTNEPQDNLTRGEQICSSLSIYETGTPSFYIIFSAMAYDICCITISCDFLYKGAHRVCLHHMLQP